MSDGADEYAGRASGFEGTAKRGGDADVRGPCPLCGRSMFDGPSVDRHHLVPRSHGGEGWAYIHRICHAKVHSVLSERELAAHFHTFERLRVHPEIERFVGWVRKMPPEYVGRHAPRRRRPAHPARSRRSR